MARIETNPLDRLDPDLALRPGDFDAHVVLVLWLLRKTFFPLLWLGMGVAIVAYGDVDSLETELSVFDSPGAMLAGLLSPLGLIVLALGVRIVTNFAALFAAYPLTLRSRPQHYTTGNLVARKFHLWRDRLYQARAYRSLRQTWSVRDRAHSRLDAFSRLYRALELGLTWANWVLLVSMIVVIGLVAGEETP
jgi:hypothetical protein